MTGINAGKVVFNYDGLAADLYARDLFEEWDGSIKAAISRDVIEEQWEPGRMGLEECHRYAVACEEVIVNLIFWCKWHRLPHKAGDGGNKS